MYPTLEGIFQYKYRFIILHMVIIVCDMQLLDHLIPQSAVKVA